MIKIRRKKPFYIIVDGFFSCIQIFKLKLGLVPITPAI